MPTWTKLVQIVNIILSRVEERFSNMTPNCEDFQFLLAVHASVHGHLHKDDTHKSTQACFHPFSHGCMEIYAIYFKALWSKQKGVPAALLSHGSGAAGFAPGIDVSVPAGLSAIERWRSWTSL